MFAREQRLMLRGVEPDSAAAAAAVDLDLFELDRLHVGAALGAVHTPSMARAVVSSNVVSAGEAALAQGDSFKEGGVLNDYTLASMVFGPECGDMRIRFWDDSAAGFRHHRIPCLAG